MNSTRQETAHIFESEVRRIARALWPDAAGGAENAFNRERDGVFETEDCFHIIEATTSRSVSSIKDKLSRLSTAARLRRSEVPHKAVRCWLVTQVDPTADQRQEQRRADPAVNLVSFHQFQSKIVDSCGYLSARSNYHFGSVRNPDNSTPSADGTDLPYVALDFVNVLDKTSVNFSDLLNLLTLRKRFALLGDYGSGKSMTLREFFLRLRFYHLRGDTPIFPVYLNLQDHAGQEDPAEILERHARKIGFSKPSQLVRAWRAGYCILLLDGFDELSYPGIQGEWKRLREARVRATLGLRALLAESPADSAIAIAGRPQYFDGYRAIIDTLRLPRGVELYSLSEFTPRQVEEYLKRLNRSISIPDWVPTRPLLLGYLVARNYLARVEDLTSLDPAAGWHHLLERLSERETERSVILDRDINRRILERLSTRARRLPDGLGPLTYQDMTTAFQEICGFAPDDDAIGNLMRMPGLGPDDSQPEARRFVDEDFADACRAGDVSQFVLDPYNFDIEAFDGIARLIGTLGLAIVVYRVRVSSVRLDLEQNQLVSLGKDFGLGPFGLQSL
jgi:NACHT domain